MKKKVIGAVVVAAALFGVVGFVKYNEYSAKEPIVQVELGDKISEKPEDYVKANKKALKETVLDFSKVDQKKVGKYPATASYDKNKINFKVEIVDTTKPKLTLVKTEDEVYHAIVGQPLNGTALIESVEDLAGVKAVNFSDGQTDGNEESENPVEQVALTLDEVGEKEVTISVEDNNGNVTKETVKVKVVEDYKSHISGFAERTIVRGTANVDWLEGITWDEKIVSVTPDAAGVDLNTVGEYKVVYHILGDDNETEITEEVKVFVIEDKLPIEAAGSTGNGKKSGENGTSRNPLPSQGGGAGSSGSSGNTGGGMTPGQSWNGNSTGTGTTSDGVNYEGGTWNPWG